MFQPGFNCVRCANAGTEVDKSSANNGMKVRTFTKAGISSSRGLSSLYRDRSEKEKGSAKRKGKRRIEIHG
jgi:hypothetical protein